MDALKIISEGSIKAEKPQFNVGDTVRVDVRIKEGDRERIQAFEGTVIAKKHGGVAETFTVRRVAYGVGIERVFPINSPFLDTNINADGIANVELRLFSLDAAFRNNLQCVHF